MKTTILINANRARGLQAGDQTYNAEHGLCEIVEITGHTEIHTAAIVKLLPALRLTLPSKSEYRH